jgi:hypothetical protein
MHGERIRSSELPRLLLVAVRDLKEGGLMILSGAVMAFAALVLAAGEDSLPTQTKECQAGGKHCRRLDARAGKLGLSDTQKKEIRKISADFHQKAAPIKEQVWRLRREKRREMGKLLTEEQRGKERDVIRAEWDRKWQASAARLNLNDEQKQRIEKIREKYRTQFRNLAGQDSSTHEQFRELRHAKIHAIGREMSTEQRHRYHRQVWAERRQRRSPEARREFWNGVGSNLGVSAEQKEQFKKLHAEYAAKIAKPVSQLQGLRHDRRAAVKNVLTKEQRSKLREMRKDRGDGKPGLKG